MVRLVALDTETTGFDPDSGHRIIEIGCVEIIDYRITDNFFHRQINPERDIPPGSTKIHGITNAMVADKPVFSKIAADFLKFIGDSRLIIHNAAFDMRFINHHLKLLKYKELQKEHVIDTLLIAKRKFLGSSVTLDALCKRYNIDLRSREYHGALIDARLLARVYIEMEYGSQASLLRVTQQQEDASAQNRETYERKHKKESYLVILPTEEELKTHNTFMYEITQK